MPITLSHTDGEDRCGVRAEPNLHRALTSSLEASSALRQVCISPGLGHEDPCGQRPSDPSISRQEQSVWVVTDSWRSSLGPAQDPSSGLCLSPPEFVSAASGAFLVSELGGKTF